MMSGEGGGFYSPPDDEEEMEEEDEGDQEIRETCPAQYMAFSQQISLQEYEKQKSDYTKSAVESLINSPEYQMKYKRCGTCWSLWLEGQSRDDCMECDGFPLTRPCPICDGKCQKTWHRDIRLSHSEHEAYWDGECGLPPDEREKFMMLKFLEPDDQDEESVLQGLQDLSTGDTAMNNEDLYWSG